MFSRKHLATVGVALIVVINGSPVEVAERELQAVSSLRVLPTSPTAASVADGIDALIPCSTKRSLGNVYFCVNDGWVAPCTLFTVDNNICYGVPDGFNDNISAFGPDEGTACILYEYVDLSIIAKGLLT